MFVFSFLCAKLNPKKGLTGKFFKDKIDEILPT